MALGFNGVPDSLDFAVGIDEKRGAHDAEKRFAEKLFHAARAVGFDGCEVGVAEKREIQFVLLLESRLSLHGIGAGTKNDHTELIELRFGVTKLGRFDGSTGGVRFRIEIEQDALALEVGERDFGSLVRLEMEVGSFVACFQHRITSQDPPK